MAQSKQQSKIALGCRPARVRLDISRGKSIHFAMKNGRIRDIFNPTNKFDVQEDSSDGFGKKVPNRRNGTLPCMWRASGTWKARLVPIGNMCKLRGSPKIIGVGGKMEQELRFRKVDLPW